MPNAFDEMTDTIYEDRNLTVPARYTAFGHSAVTIRVQDFRDGVAQGPSNGPQAVTVSPEIWARRADLEPAPSKGTLQVGDEDDAGNIVWETAVYEIVSWRPRLTGAGVATGEVRLTMRKVS